MFSGRTPTVRRVSCAVTVTVLATSLLLLAFVVAPAAAVPPELPRVFLDTTDAPPTGRLIAVPAGGDFRAALEAALPGDVIMLEAGATYQGPFVLPNKAGAGWISVRTSAPDGLLPPPGTRVNPSHAPVMPKIVVGSGLGGALQAAPGAHHFRFVGIEVHPLPGAFVFNLIDLGTGAMTDAALPHDIIFDRSYIHGDPVVGGRRGIAMNSKSTAVIDSYVADFKEVGADTQAIASWGGPGPFKIVNNYVEAAGENVLFGGADPRIPGLVPSDVEVRHNYFFKPLSWKGGPWVVKNLFELKNARRVLIDGNIFENNWLAAQNGHAILFTVRNQDGTAPWSTVEDVTFTDNILRHTASGFNIHGHDDLQPSQPTTRILIRDNLVDDVNSAVWGGSGRVFTLIAGISDLTIDHNTAFSDQAILIADVSPHTGFVYTNNLMPVALFGVLGTGTGQGFPTLTTWFPLSVFARNALVGGSPAIYPADNFFPASLDQVGFVNRAGGDYRLAASSPYKGMGTDGKDIGADFDALSAATAGATTGVGAPPTPPPPPPPALSVAPATLVDFGSVVVGQSADRSFTVTNTGGSLVTGTVSTSAPFSILSGASFSLAPGASQPVVVRFSPTTAGIFAVSVNFASDGGAVSGAVTGTGTLLPDTTLPAVSLTAPAPGATVSGTVTVAASATDNVGVVGAQFKLDGTNLGAEVTTPPYNVAWNTATAPNGSHTLTAVARDAAGNVATSTPVSVTVANTAALPPDTVLQVNSASLDPPTLHALGVQMLISGDTNRNAAVTVRYRPAGSGVWREGLPLFRVFPETITQPVPEQFAGSIFDLTPDTSYEIELRATDADGPVDDIRILTGRTRPVPREDPVTSRTITVTSAPQFQSALTSALPGDVIVLANGIYPGTFVLGVSGTAENPIVVRGESASGVILDGQGCSPCTVLEATGSHIHVERLTIQNAFRAFRFSGTGTRNNVARRVRITNVVHGIAQGVDQRDFYICDNVIEGRLAWPWVFQPDASTHWDDRGVAVHGDGHVVCHNRISGFGDPMINTKVLARSIDFYGNDILDSFDGTELDLGGGNVRVFGNRWTNVAAGVSLQPVYGGPAYVLRNVLLNVVDEQIKFKSLGGTDEPSGALFYHNTFVSPEIALNLQTPITGHNFRVMNNLFVGPHTLLGRTAEWTAKIDRGKFDFNGYFPDGGFWLGSVNGVNQFFANFGALKASGVFEGGGALLTEPIFAGGFVGPADGTVRQSPADFTLAAASSAIDHGTVLPGINQAFAGAAPDLGALESGCPAPTYGPRPAGSERLTPAIDCNASPPPPTWPADAAPPTVGVTAPTSGSTLSGVVAVSASASDNVGVAGVQFELNGANLGAEVAAAPYSITWDTTTVANGSYTVTAVARDAAGNSATAAPVTVTVSNVVAAPTPTRSSFTGTPFPVPGSFEAEDFDNGGEGVAYHDLTAGNQGGLYRIDGDVDIIAPALGVRVVNNFQTGEWLEYSINVTASGTYRIDGLVSSQFTTSRWHAEVDGVNITGSVLVPNTGWWGTFQWVGVGGIPLTAGPHILRIHAEQEYFNLNGLRIVAEGVQNVVWTSLVNVTAAGNSLQKSAGCDGCQDAEAVSVQTITSGDGYLEFTASEATTSRVIGLSHGNTDTTRADIDFALQMWPGGGVSVHENGIYRTETPSVPGDLFRIAVVNGQVRYSKNGVVFYTSVLAPTYPLLVDSALLSLSATLKNVVISGASPGV